MAVLSIRNRQQTRALDTSLLRQITRNIIELHLGTSHYEVGIHLIDDSEMARMNEQFLQHSGSTDVITFDHGSSGQHLHGEIFVSVPDAVKHAREFKTTWQSEVARYVIHGLLHLRGYDDLQPAKRRLMKRNENRLVKEIASRFTVKRLARSRTPKLKIRST